MPGPQPPVVRYAPGPGTLLGAGVRWLLLDVPADEPRLEEIWELLTAPVVDRDRAVAEVEGRYGADVSLVLLDLTPGSGGSVERGTGRLRHDGERRVLILGLGDAPDPRRRLASGMVAAGCAELLPAPRRPTAAEPARTPEAPAPGVIDGVPPEILAPSAPTPPLDTQPPRPEVEEVALRSSRREAGGERQRPTPDRSTSDGIPRHTTYRADRAARLTGDAAGPDADHLRQRTHETVLAVRCSHGHLTPAVTANCRVCHQPVPPQEPERVPRPRLGVLRLPDGTAIPLDRGVVFGRQPSPAGGDPWPQLVRLPNDNSYVSRDHLQVELDGWLVLATDLGSRGGTTLRSAGRDPQRIRAGERYIWEPGQVLDLADSYEILYEVLPDDAQADAARTVVDDT